MIAAITGIQAARAALKSVGLQQAALEPVLVVSDANPSPMWDTAWRVGNKGDGAALAVEAFVEIRGDGQVRNRRFDLGDLERGESRVFAISGGTKASPATIRSDSVRVLLGWNTGASIGIDGEIADGIGSLNISAARREVPSDIRVTTQVTFQCRTRFRTHPAIKREWERDVRLDYPATLPFPNAVAIDPWTEEVEEALAAT